MRLRASLGALAGVVWLTSAAAVPRLDEVFDSTCSTAAVEATTAVAPESSCSTTPLEHATTTARTNSTCSGTSAGQATGPLTTPTPIPKAVTSTDRSSGLRTVTVTKVTVGAPTAELTLPTLTLPTLPTVPTPTLPTVPTLTLPTVPTLTVPTLTLPTVPTLPTIIVTPTVSVVTVTVGAPTAELTLPTLTLPTVPTLTLPTVPTLTLPTVPTLTVPTITVPTLTLPTVPTLPTLSATPMVSVVTVTVSEDASTLGSVVAVTAPPILGPTLTATVPQPFQSASTSVLTLTYPDGPSHTATELITITIPQFSWSPELWSTVVTPSAIPSPLASQDLTVTVYASPSSAVGAHSTLVPFAVTETFTAFIGRSTTVTTVTEFLSLVSGTPVVTVLTPHPISNSLGSVPIVPLTITLTSAITSTSSMTIQTAPPAAPQTGGRNDGTAASSPTARPDPVTVTVTALVALPQASAISDASTLSSSVQPAIVTVTVSELFSSSIEGPGPYGATSSFVTTTDSSSPDRGTELSSLTILTTSIPEATGYGFLSSTSTSDDATVVVTVTELAPVVVVTITESAHKSTVTPSSSISSTFSPFRSSTGSVVFATYTVPGESGVGVSTYTVTYTVPPSGTSSWGYESGPNTSSSTFWPTPTSESASVEASAIGSSTYTITVTPVDASGTGAPVTITYTLGPSTVPGSSTLRATTFISSVEPVLATSQASGYGAGFSSQPDASRASPSQHTVTHSSTSPVFVTASEDADSTTTSAGTTPVVVTVTEHVTSPIRSVPSSILHTGTPSSPTAITLSSDTALSTKSGEYQYDSTGAVLPTSVPNTPTAVTITEETSSSPTPADVSTIVVSMVTLSQTVPIGYGSSAVVELTTEVTVVASSHSLAAPASTVLVSPVGPTSATSVIFPRPSNSLTSIVLTTVMLSSSRGPSLGPNNTATMQPPDEVTIWPPPVSSSSAADHNIPQQLGADLCPVHFMHLETELRRAVSWYQRGSIKRPHDLRADHLAFADVQQLLLDVLDQLSLINWIRNLQHDRHAVVLGNHAVAGINQQRIGRYGPLQLLQ
ncbi:hypothetical protein C8A01DRAFT_37504 [Parachaetomium inaequale]|uniref:Uncharacterized protein n=1 Tax=Parachaetomium inaequale TaxID=2588326 RepID=A0AAN6SPR5_9PEZI|nr:hypothetical protein C8A01DRAFT_37504 [Parachaetomium inaequale]